MIKFTVTGKPVSSNDFGKELMAAAVNAVASEMRERLSALRHPDTGEFPTVVVRGESLDDRSFLVEGSPELLALVRERLSREDLQLVQLGETDKTSTKALRLDIQSRLRPPVEKPWTAALDDKWIFDETYLVDLAGQLGLSSTGIHPVHPDLTNV